MINDIDMRPIPQELLARVESEPDGMYDFRIRVAYNLQKIIKSYIDDIILHNIIRKSKEEEILMLINDIPADVLGLEAITNLVGIFRKAALLSIQHDHREDELIIVIV